jgi:hypothetical protein
MATMETAEADFRRRLEQALGEGYRLGEPLGRGGFAVVYAATDQQLKRRIAVKVLRRELASVPGALERFRREAEAVARLRHPNIIPIYAVGSREDLAYFLMPLIEGGSLADGLVREPRLAVAEVRRVLRESAAGLAAAHRAGIVHRDIKPDNMLLEGPERRVVLTDFGIAKALGGDTGTLTQTGAVIGTPHYMSPEQASGERAIDHRADIYSLGVVAYQMLTGQVPFNGATLAAVLVQHLTAEPPPISRSRPDCPPALAAAVARCLAKTPDERWGSVEDFAHALETAEATTTAFRPAIRSSGARAVENAPIRRFRRTLAIGGGVVLLLVVVDVATHQVLLGPLGAIVSGFLVAAAYGRLWTAGYSWRDIVSRGGIIPALAVSPLPLDSAELGPHRGSVHQARTDRAAMLGSIQGLPRAERLRLGQVLTAVDALIARVTENARTLVALERQLEPGLEEISRRLADTRAELPSPGREQRVVVLERRLQAIRSLSEQRRALTEHLTARLTAVTNLRFALDSVLSTGFADGGPALSAATEAAAALAKETVLG